jgi:predicted Zn-dependent protease/TolB-like protein
MRALDSAGDRGSAIQFAESFQALLQRELDVEPDPEVTALAEQFRSQAGTRNTSSAFTQRISPAEEIPDAVIAASRTTTTPTRREVRSWWLIAAAGLVLVSLGAGVSWLGGTRLQFKDTESTPGVRATPVIAILVDPVSGADSTADWMTAGLSQMIADYLGRVSGVEVVPPGIARAVRWSANADEVRGALDISAEDVRELARRLGATLVLRGSLTATSHRLVLDVTIADAATGHIVRADTWADSSALTMADRAAAAVLSVAGAQGPGFRLNEVETASTEAYQHFARAMVLLSRDDAEGDHELDLAVALDSNFVSALHYRFRRSFARNDPIATRKHLHDRLRFLAERATERDRLEFQAFDAFISGEHARSETLARTLVRRFPNDPRGYDLLADIYANHGQLLAAAEIALEKLTLARRIGVSSVVPAAQCVECSAVGLAVTARLEQGAVAEAIKLASDLTASRPELPAPWTMYAQALTRAGRFDDALAAWKRVTLLRGRPGAGAARTLITARRFEAADSAITALLISASPTETRTDALDARVMLARERGQFRVAVQTADSAAGLDPGAASLRLMSPGALARLGDRLSTERRARELRAVPWIAVSEIDRAQHARGWSWHAALAADAIAEWADTSRLLLLADSLEQIGRLSAYARDWRLHHHIRGLVHLRAGRNEEAIRELEAALFGSSGWTKTNIELARAFLALGRSADAVNILRPAYRAPLDAMGRYVARSELDFYMSLAFAAANQRDSAEVYAGYVRRAWQAADPEIARRTASLPH